jgi:hypothetical protein
MHRKVDHMSAKKTGGARANKRAADVARASAMAKQGVKRTTFRDPITGNIRPVGSYPGMSGAIKG